jgi:L-threonylcarbamoyladenylate synthase
MIRITMDDRKDGPGPEEAVRCLRDGGIVCFPTDTAYGLAVDPFQPEAVETLFRLKGRPAEKPILLLVDSMSMLESVALPPPGFTDFAARFWPGPITAILPAREGFSERITASTGTVGVRWPDASIPLNLLAAFGRPVTATSANRSGMPVAATVDEALAQFSGGDGVRLAAAIDDGPRPRTGASTIIDMTVDPRVVVRDGLVAFADLAGFLGGRVRRAAV